MLIRSATDSDIPALRHLYNYLIPERPTDAYVLERINDYRVRVAVQADEQVVGFSVLSRRKTMPPEQAFLWVAVDDEFRRQGIGSALLSDAIQHARQCSYTEYISQIDRHHSAANAFCQAYNFQITRHMIYLALDVSEWDEAAFRARLKPLPESIHCRTYADLGDTPQNRRKLYNLNRALSETIPIDEPEDFPDFAPYAERHLESDHFPHDAIHIMVHDDEWIGLSQIALYDRYAFVSMTGVHPAYRGRGLAQRLKWHSLRYVQQTDYQTVRTTNDAVNAPMLAVNEKTGFQRQKEVYFVSRQLDS